MTKPSQRMSKIKELSFTGIVQSILTTSSIGIIPVSIHVLNEQRKLFKKHFEMAGKMGKNNMQRKLDQSIETITFNAQEYIVNDILFDNIKRSAIKISGDSVARFARESGRGMLYLTKPCVFTQGFL